MVMTTALSVTEILCLLYCKLTMALDQIKEDQKADDAHSYRNTSNVVY